MCPVKYLTFWVVFSIAGYGYPNAQKQWHLLNDIKLEKHFNSLNRFYPLDSNRAAVFQWRRDSKILIYDMSNGQLQNQVSIRAEDIERLEQEVAERVTGCTIIPFEDPSGKDTTKVYFETLFYDDDKYWVGWELLMRIDQEDGTYENELVAVLSRLTEAFELTDHRIILPSGMECKKEFYLVFSENFYWRCCNALWKDTLYMLRQMDYLKPGYAFYEEIPLNNLNQRSFSAYKYQLDDILFWFHTPDTSDMSIAYAFTFVNDSEDLLCHTYVKSELFYYDKRIRKYAFDTESFGTLWSFEKQQDTLLIASSKRIEGRLNVLLSVFDHDGHPISEMRLLNAEEDEQAPVYLGPRLHHGLFYVIYRIGQEYFVRTYRYH